MKPTQVLCKRIARLQLTTKQTNKGYYKGTGSGSMGRHTQHGGYIIELAKVRTYVCPDLKDFKLTPFITRRIKPVKSNFEGDKLGALSGKRYLAKWKAENGVD